MIASPESRDVNFNVFLDVLGNNSAETGVLVSAEFSLTSISESNYIINVSVDDYDSLGNITLNLNPGKYIVDFISTLASDENATDFNTFYISEQIFVEFNTDEAQLINLFLVMKDWLKVF